MDEGFQQPGDSDQLGRVIQVAEREYEHRLIPLIVYWDEISKRYRLGYQSQYKSQGTIEVVRIPK